jgi:hypothetical protein
MTDTLSILKERTSVNNFDKTATLTEQQIQSAPLKEAILTPMQGGKTALSDSPSPP